MRAIVCESWRDFDALEVKDIPAPPLRPRSVRIKVSAAGVSFATQLVVAGKYQRKPPLPFVPGTEAVGTVIEASPDADAPPPGTQVFAVMDWGAMAEEVVVDDIHVMPIPDGMPLQPAIAFPISLERGSSVLPQLPPGQAIAQPRALSPELTMAFCASGSASAILATAGCAA